MREQPPGILGISFDGLAVSGIVNECLNLASIFHRSGFRVLIDLGFDIRGRAPADTKDEFPPWAATIRSIGNNPPPGYSAALIQQGADLANAGTAIDTIQSFNDMCDELAARLVYTLEQHRIRVVVVENGTLPDNPMFTEALYRAIDEHGARHKLGKFVLWRDHDLMWSAEPHRFGPYPYPGVRKPRANEHIEYAVLTDWMRVRMRAWSAGLPCRVIPNRFYVPRKDDRARQSLRATYGIPDDAYLIARCTRVVPQKSIERDLYLLQELQQRLTRRVFLFVTGPTQEDADEFDRLCALERSLSLSGQVIWADGVLPFHASLWKSREANRFSVLDLLQATDLSSFLTTYDYEGFGNPPGEAMATGVPFVATTYELYHDVYGKKGVIAPLLPIKRRTAPSEPIPNDFIDWTIRLLEDAEYRKQVTDRNLAICRRHFSLDALERQIFDIFDIKTLGAR
jgi:glycosyltransferase involved in cell wall biosynthesis